MYQPQGLILVTGKTNSGKTTTLNALVNEINETQNKKILSLENPVEYKHTSKKSMIVQKEIGVGGDAENFSEGVKNSLREDCDILVIGEIRDKVTMEAAIEMAESGHLVVGTLHTKSCAETIDRMINFYEVKEQETIKYLLASLLKLVVSQRLIKGTDGKLALVPEIMVVDNIVAGMIRKEKLSVAEMIAKAKQKASETKDCFENRSQGLLPVGTRVFHSQFGVGKITNIEDKNYVVEFTKNGTKTRLVPIVNHLINTNKFKRVEE
jgi:pilus retraction protein PilT